MGTSVSEHPGEGEMAPLVFTVRIPNFTLEMQAGLTTSEVLGNPSTCGGGCRL